MGVITEVHSSRHELTIHHDEIENFMMAMTMNFKLKPNDDIGRFSVGDSVHFRLSFEGNNGFGTHFTIIDNVVVDVKDDDDFWDEDDPYAPIEIGDTLTNASFTDMFGNSVRLSDSDGKFRFISFIFTRCPMPNMCPAVVMKNRYLVDRFSDMGSIDFILVSFDHKYDTPSVLRQTYGSSAEGHKNLRIWSSTGHVDDVYRLVKQSGGDFWGVEEERIGHTLRSVLIGPERELLASWKGEDWKVEHVERAMEMFIK